MKRSIGGLKAREKAVGAKVGKKTMKNNTFKKFGENTEVRDWAIVINDARVKT